MKSFRSLHIVIYVTVIGVILSFALCRGDKAELNYYDFAELVTHNTDRDNRSDETRYTNIGLSEEKRNEIKNIMADFDFSCFLKNSHDEGRGQIMNHYYIITVIKNESYILTINDRGDVDKNSFELDEIVQVIDGRFLYKNVTKNPVIHFQDRELSKRLNEFIQENKSLIDGKMNNIKQQQPKYSSPMIQRIHERYCKAADRVEDWAYDLYYRLVDP